MALLHAVLISWNALLMLYYSHMRRALRCTAAHVYGKYSICLETPTWVLYFSYTPAKVRSSFNFPKLLPFSLISQYICSYDQFLVYIVLARVHIINSRYFSQYYELLMFIFCTRDQSDNHNTFSTLPYLLISLVPAIQ